MPVKQIRKAFVRERRAGKARWKEGKAPGGVAEAGHASGKALAIAATARAAARTALACTLPLKSLFVLNWLRRTAALGKLQ